MRILIVTAPHRAAGPHRSGQWGQRIAAHVRSSAPSDWHFVEMPEWPASAQSDYGTSIPATIWDEPEDILPQNLPQTDLLLVLTESVGMTDLVPDLARLCGAQAVIVPVDRRSWAPQGLIGQARRRLQAMGIASVWPMPFCTLVPGPGQHPRIREFASRYGRPELTCTVQDDTLLSCQVTREAPCGNTRYIVSQLVGVETGQAVERCGLLHHYYPCWGGMETDPVHNTHSLLHIAATIAQNSMKRALENSSADRIQAAQTGKANA